MGLPITLDFLRDRTQLDELSGCWIWTGAINHATGYGAIKHGARTLRTHRVAYEIATGLSLPSKIDVCHRCDVKARINPDHLFHGTRKDNMRDCAEKGRIWVPGHIYKGELCPASKLTAQQVLAVRQDERSTRVLGAIYGVSRHTISAIKRRLTWRSV